MSARAAVAFLTVVPVRAPAAPLERTAVWFPLVGALVGAAAGGVRAGLDPLTGAGPATALGLATAVVLTGGLHHDGLADAADGLGPRTRERALEAMRDHATGAFGVLALVGWALAAWSALLPLDGRDGVLALIAAGAAGRAAAVAHAGALAPARQDGLGAAFAVRALPAGAAAVIGAAIALAALGAAGGAIALAAVAGTTLLWSRLCLTRFGGRTGDTLGATVLLAELAVLLVAA